MGKLYDDYFVPKTSRLPKLPPRPTLEVTRLEFEALRAKVTELEQRLSPVTKLSNAEKQKAYRKRKKVTLAETAGADG